MRAHRSRLALCALVAAAFGTAACTPSTPATTTTATTTAPAPAPAPTWWKPTPKTTWDIQIGAATVNPAVSVQAVEVDLFDTSQATIDTLRNGGKKVICYFSTQYENWRDDAKKGAWNNVTLGNPIDNWVGENWVDIKDPDLVPVLNARLDLAKTKKCDAVDPDNIDGYDNASGFSYPASDYAAFVKNLAVGAHGRGLAIGQKNALANVPALVAFLDFAVNEQCVEYNECGALNAYVNANKAVFGIEYQGDPAAFCPKQNTAKFSWLKKRLALDTTIVADCLQQYP